MSRNQKVGFTALAICLVLAIFAIRRSERARSVELRDLDGARCLPMFESAVLAAAVSGKPVDTEKLTDVAWSHVVLLAGFASPANELRRAGIVNGGAAPWWIGFQETAALVVFLDGDRMTQWMRIDGGDVVVSLETRIGTGFRYSKDDSWRAEFSDVPNRRLAILSIDSR